MSTDKLHITLPPRTYSTPRIDNEYPFWVCQFGTSSRNNPWHEIRIKSDVSCLQYVVSGSGTIICDNHAFRVSKGDTFLLLEGRNQNYYSDADDPLEKLWFNFKGILSTEIIKIYKLENIVLFRNIFTLDLISEMINLCSTIKNPKELQKATSQHFLKIIQFLDENNVRANDNQEIVDYIRYYIDSHITENIKISDIAAFSHYSSEHVIRLFKKKYNTTPHQYIIKCKLNIAISMLQVTDKTIEQISNDLGYTDPHHFSSQFEKHIGCRPSTYRANFKNK